MPKKSQIDKFKEAARASGAAQNEKAFNSALKKVAAGSVTEKKRKKRR